jgi:urease accessory protein
MNVAGPLGRGAAHSHAAGWRAALALGFEARAGRTVLAHRTQQGPLLVQRPFHPESNGTCHTYLIHPPGGIVGGDWLELDADASAGTRVLLTTPAATRWYFSAAREARLTQRLRVASDATLEWLPQETLVYDGAHARMETRVELASGARFIGWEILGLGRPARGERFTTGQLDFRFEIHRDGVPLLLERLRATDGQLPGMLGCSSAGTFLAAGADECLLARVREILPEPADDLLAGATLIGDLLLCRALGAQCAVLAELFRCVWQQVRPAVVGSHAAEPRIWRT